MNKLKAFGIGLMLTGAAMIGDCCNVNDHFVNPIRYRNVRIEPTSYQKPFKIQKKYVINETGMLELHIGHDQKWYKTGKELRVNERSLEQMLKDQGNELARNIKEKYEKKQPIIKEYLNKIIEMYKEIFRVEDGNS